MRLLLLLPCFVLSNTYAQSSFVQGQLTNFEKTISELASVTYNSSTRTSFEANMLKARKSIFDIRYDSPSYNTKSMETKLSPYYDLWRTQGPSAHKGLSKTYEQNKLNEFFTAPEGQLQNYGYHVIEPEELFEIASIYLTIYHENFPEDDITEYNEYIKNVTNAYIQEREKNKKFNENYAYFREEYEKLFNPNLNYSTMYINEENTVESAEKQLAQYKSEIEIFVSSEAADLVRGDVKWPMKEYVERLKDIHTFGQELNNLTTLSSKNGALTAWYKNQMDWAWLGGMKKLFGENPELTRQEIGIQKVTDYLISPENAIKMAEENEARMIADRKLLPAKMTDQTQLLNDIRAAVAVSSFGKNQEITEIRIVSNGWNLYRHWLSGEVMYREIAVQMVTKENGECILHEFIAREEFDGQTYEKCYVGYHNAFKMLCENAK